MSEKQLTDDVLKTGLSGDFSMRNHYDGVQSTKMTTSYEVSK